MEQHDNVLESLISDIENSTAQVIEKKPVNETFELWRDPALTVNLAGNIGALFVRAILNKLNVNEHHVFRWRLDNKYRQYQVLNHYFPGSVARTIGISQLLAENNGPEKIRELCESGFFIKCTLGHRTGQANSFDRTAELEDIIKLHQEKKNQRKENQEKEGQTEQWILQERLDLNEEFRIHTFGRDLIYGLTFIMAGSDSSKSTTAEIFVQKTLATLPDTLLQGTLIGWDIGVTNANEYYIIEANFTGFHPEYYAGFQTSGYFGDPEYGPAMCAWLNNYFKNKYQISINAVNQELIASGPFFEEFLYYQSIFSEEHIAILQNKTKGKLASALIYSGEGASPFLANLVEYFLQEDFAKNYYLITNEETVFKTVKQFSGNNQIGIIAEQKLFMPEEYPLIQQLSYQQRKKICCDKLIAIIGEPYYFIL
ncbi:hypothetical protein [Pedobacter cryoconitis]|uniref:ATP-grasp domain-containing protein n=1 Tax=Pedobacter cryoconitis TaxID=188932 RepID=A0A327SKU0_9SPHI|nr:hypothetical protein [Pedobacter cryoconitis]RAJ26357.1 hypothetical protein LY11_03801 [Pedobacter cryoconitis]